MPSRPRKNIKQRSRYLVACEGKSESGYAALIQKLADRRGLSIYLDIQNCKGGDPLSIVQVAIKKLRKGRKSRADYAGHAIFLDGDRRGDSPDRTMRADQLIAQHNFIAIWSKPTFEALILNHLPNCGNLNPPNAKQSLRVLKQHWPEYEKGMSAVELSQKIDISAIERVAATNTNLHKCISS